MEVARHLSPLIFLTLLIAALGYVFWRGERAERACVLVIVVASILSALAAHPNGMWQRGETGIFIVDVAALFAFITIMGASNRFWPLWITAFQIIAVTTHLARFLKPATLPMAYAFAEQLWVLPMQGLLVAVIWQRQHTRRSFPRQDRSSRL